MHLTCSHTLTETFLSNLPSSPPPSLCLPPTSETFLRLSFTALRCFIRSQRALQIPPHPFYNIQLFSQQKHERIKQNMKPFLSYSKKTVFHQPAQLSHPQGYVRAGEGAHIRGGTSSEVLLETGGEAERSCCTINSFVSHRLWKLQAAQLKLCLT